MAAISPRNEAPHWGTDASFRQFEHAVMSLVHGGCCATPTLSAVRRQPAPPMRQNTKFRRLGHDAWLDTVSPRAPILPTIRGAFILPDVTVAHGNRADDKHVDVLVSQANIDRITPSGTADIPPSATVFEHARGSFVASALIDMHAHMSPANVLRLTDIFLLQTLRHGITIVRDAGDTDGTATPAALARVGSGRCPVRRATTLTDSSTPARRAGPTPSRMAIHPKRPTSSNGCSFLERHGSSHTRTWICRGSTHSNRPRLMRAWECWAMSRTGSATRKPCYRTASIFSGCRRRAASGATTSSTA
jgi:hypothetical protein